MGENASRPKPPSAAVQWRQPYPAPLIPRGLRGAVGTLEVAAALRYVQRNINPQYELILRMGIDRLLRIFFFGNDPKSFASNSHVHHPHSSVIIAVIVEETKR